MTTTPAKTGTPQGFGPDKSERLPMPPLDKLTPAQRAAADAIIAGPRKAVFGPFVPLLQCPALMEKIGATGEVLRFAGTLPDAVREIAMLVAARETNNQFEWQTHVALGLKAGVPPPAIDALAEGRPPRGIEPQLEVAVDVATAVVRHHGISDATYAAAVKAFGEHGVIELTAVVGYLTMVCWIMNVARTPGPTGSTVPPLTALPG